MQLGDQIEIENSSSKCQDQGAIARAWRRIPAGRRCRSAPAGQVRSHAIAAGTGRGGRNDEIRIQGMPASRLRPGKSASRSSSRSRSSTALISILSGILPQVKSSTCLSVGIGSPLSRRIFGGSGQSSKSAVDSGQALELVIVEHPGSPPCSRMSISIASISRSRGETRRGCFRTFRRRRRDVQ